MNSKRVLIVFTDGSQLKGTMSELNYNDMEKAIRTGRHDTWHIGGEWYRTYQLASITIEK